MPADLLLKKFGSLTEVQKQVIGPVAEGRNVIIIAPTGSGKTESAAIPVLKKISDMKLEGIAALYITPLRSLNRDLLKRLVGWAKELGITIAVRHGDTTQSERALQAKSPPQFLITTPETLQAILPAKKMGEALRNVKFVIVDEIHELVDDKRGAQLSLGLERLAEKAGEFQRVGISATVADPNNIGRYLCGLRAFTVVDLKYMKSMKFDITYPHPHLNDEAVANELNVDSPAAARLREIQKIVKDKKTLIFVNTRSIAEILGSRLMKMDKTIGVHHGSLSKDTRIKLEDDFKTGKLNALVSTSSLELGIDIGDINHVIQYMSPRQVSRLVQRVGRSGHTTKGTSTGTIMCAEPDDLLEAMAIVEMIKQGMLEEQQMCIGALDVLAHQIAGIVLDREQISTADMFSIIKRSYPYSLIDPDQFISVVNFMTDKRLIKKTDQDIVHRMMSTRQYYYENLSTIPSVSKYFVKDTATNSTISTLDENFVMFLEKNDLFITKGTPWHILDIDTDKRQVIVEPSEEISAAIPDWEGEEIPTSFEVAQRVGQIRQRIADGKEHVKEAEADIKEFEGKPPTDKHIYIEAWGDVAVMHLLGGLKVNRTIATILGHSLAKEYGSSVRTLVDPYRIAFVFPRAADAMKVKSYLLRITNVSEELKQILPTNQIFKYKLLHVGKLFGIFREAPRISDRFILAFQGTPLVEETTREVLSSYFDIKNSEYVLKALRNKEISVTARAAKQLSSIATRALQRYHGSELIAPIEPTSEILKAFKNKLLSKSAILYCTYCGHDWISFIGELPDKISCNRCKSNMITVLGDINWAKVLKKKKLTKEEKDWKMKLDKTAAIVSASGKNGVIALATYGIGPTKAATVLSRKYHSEEEFYAALLNAQKTFIRTKRFWEIH